jgi:phage baseplate assembly protein W
MAARIYNVKTVDTGQAQAGDFSQQTFAYKGFNSKSVTTGFKQHDIDLIKQDLLNHFHIKKGEKLMNPEFGTIIWDMIFEPMTQQNLQMIQDDVAEIINRDPRITANNIAVDGTDYGIRIEVELTYNPLNITERLAINFDKNSVPNK